jgi:hypothetical protein
LSDAIEHIYPLLPLAAFWILLGPGDGFNRLLYILFRPLVSLIALKDSAPLYLIVLLLEVRMPPFSDETNLSATVIGSTQSLDAENNPFEALPSFCYTIRSDLYWLLGASVQKISPFTST